MTSFSVETRYEIWNDENGSRVDVGPDADALDLIEIRHYDGHQARPDQHFVLTLEQASKLFLAWASSSNEAFFANLPFIIDEGVEVGLDDDIGELFQLKEGNLRLCIEPEMLPFVFDCLWKAMKDNPDWKEENEVS